MADQDLLTLDEAVTRYVSSLKDKDSHTESQQSLRGFVREMGGGDRPLREIRPTDVEKYGERRANSGAQSAERLQAVKNFLSYAKKVGLTGENLGRHIRIPRARKSAKTAPADAPKTVEITRERWQALNEDLQKRTEDRGRLAAQIRRAAADKDVRENAPLEMARQEQGFNEAKIREIEDALNAAVIVDDSKTDSTTIGLGAKVLLKDVKTGRETRYTLVSAMEAAPLEGKISDASPVGRALMRKSAGQEVQVKTPRGAIKYRIVKVTA